MKRFVLFFICICTCLATLGGTALAVPQTVVGLNDVIATVEKSFRVGTGGQAPISSFTADFFQRTMLARERREMRGEGVLSVQTATASSPLMYRFDYYRPNQQQIICDGSTLWIYHPENREVIMSDVSFLYNHLSIDPNRDRAVNFLHGLHRISKDFQINFASGMNDAAGNYVLELTPRRAMLNTRRILMVVSSESVLAYVRGGKALPASIPSRTVPTPPAARTPFNTPQAYGIQQPPWVHSSDPFPILSTTTEDQEGNSITMEFANININTRFSQGTFTFLIPAGVQAVRPSQGGLPR